jgi:hypothetical protein
MVGVAVAADHPDNSPLLSDDASATTLRCHAPLSSPRAGPALGQGCALQEQQRSIEFLNCFRANQIPTRDPNIDKGLKPVCIGFAENRENWSVVGTKFNF